MTITGKGKVLKILLVAGIVLMFAPPAACFLQSENPRYAIAILAAPLLAPLLYEMMVIPFLPDKILMRLGRDPMYPSRKLGYIKENKEGSV